MTKPSPLRLPSEIWALEGDSAMIAYSFGTWLAQIPNPAPSPPPGADAVTGVLQNAKWGAGVALMLGFFIGLIVWAGGRWVDHHRAGKIGLVMMLCAVGGAILYGIGWTMINGFAGG